jgi:ADP-ribose pyrophosphatase YjhB (NUDIX family)
MMIDCAYRELEEETGLTKEDIVEHDHYFDKINHKGNVIVKLYLATVYKLKKPRSKMNKSLLLQNGWILMMHILY